MSRRYAYLGPAGTFTEMALRRLCEGAPAGEVEAVPTGSVDAALAALREGSVDAAVVPIENSVEGGVSATLDALAAGDALVVIGEVLVPVTFVLAAPAGTSLAEVRAVGTHPHAWAQVRGWMDTHLPGATYVPALSTAAAAAGLAGGQLVERHRHRPLDGVLDRHDRPVGLALADRVERDRHGRAGLQLGPRRCRQRPQGLLGEGPLGTEVGVAGGRDSGHEGQPRGWRRSPGR